jgi:hypothetical protein
VKGLGVNNTCIVTFYQLHKSLVIFVLCFPKQFYEHDAVSILKTDLSDLAYLIF